MASTVQAAPVKLLVFGDSLTAGYGLPGAQGFTARLEERLKKDGLDVQVINGGVSGDTSAGGRARIDWTLADKPDFAIVELGANDGLRGLDTEEMYVNLDTILTAFDKAGIPVMLAGMYAPPNFGQDYSRKFQTVYGRLVEKHKPLFYPFFLDGVAADPSLNQADGIHPNQKGVDIIVDRILPLTKTLLKGKG